jgi:hypothetical protein
MLTPGHNCKTQHQAIGKLPDVCQVLLHKGNKMNLSILQELHTHMRTHKHTHTRAHTHSLSLRGLKDTQRTNFFPA